MNDDEFDFESCARCGSSLGNEPCEWCPYWPGWGRPDPSCLACSGTGYVSTCLSSEVWCMANPLPGREDVLRHTVERSAS